AERPRERIDDRRDVLPIHRYHGFASTVVFVSAPQALQVAEKAAQDTEAPRPAIGRSLLRCRDVPRLLLAELGAEVKLAPELGGLARVAVAARSGRLNAAAARIDGRAPRLQRHGSSSSSSSARAPALRRGRWGRAPPSSDRHPCRSTDSVAWGARAVERCGVS